MYIYIYIQELLDLKSNPLQIMHENIQSETDGDIPCHMQSLVSPQYNGSAFPEGNGSVLPHVLPNRQDIALSVSHLSAQWTDVS